MTEDEHIKLIEVGDHFHDEFGKLVADCLKKVPESMHFDMLNHLSDQSSVWGSCYSEYMEGGENI